MCEGIKKVWINTSIFKLNSMWHHCYINSDKTKPNQEVYQIANALSIHAQAMR